MKFFVSLQEAIALIREAIEKYLGPARAKAMSDGQIVREHLGNGQNLQADKVKAAINGIMLSPEADAYFKSQQNASPPTDPGAPPPAGTPPPPVAPTPTVPVSPGPTTDPFKTRPTPGQIPDQGYDPAKWGSMNSLKYRASEILARYPATPAGLKQAFADPDFKATFPNARLVGKDTIDFGGQLSDFDRGVPVYDVDVGISFDDAANTGLRWGWQDQKNTGAGPASTGATPTFAYPTSPTPPIDPASNGNPAPPPDGGSPTPAPPATDPERPNVLGSVGSSISMAQFLQQGQQTAQAAQGAQRSPYDLSMAEYLSRLSQARNQRIGRIGGV